MKTLATAARCSFCSGSRSCGTHFAMTHVMPRPCIKILVTVAFGTPRPASVKFSHCQSLVFADCSPCTFNILRCSACLPERGSVPTDSRPSLKHLCHFYLCCTRCIVPESLLNHPNSFCGGTFKSNAKFDADQLLYSLNHFECGGHAGHVLTQWHLPPPLTSAVKSSLFTHVHSSPLSLAARLHPCHANHSCYSNNS